MSNTNETTDNNETVSEEELTPEQEADVVKALEQLKSWQQNVFITAMAGGIKDKYDEMLIGQGLGKVKNNNFNKGYMSALRDIYQSMCLLLDEEGLKIVQGQLAEETEAATKAKSEESNNNEDSETTN